MFNLECCGDWDGAEPDPLYAVARLFARSSAESSQRLAARREAVECLLQRLVVAEVDERTIQDLRAAVAELGREVSDLAATVGAETARRVDLPRLYDQVVAEAGLVGCQEERPGVCARPPVRARLSSRRVRTAFDHATGGKGPAERGRSTG